MDEVKSVIVVTLTEVIVTLTVIDHEKSVIVVA
jgi:hypothetical protein